MPRDIRIWEIVDSNNLKEIKTVTLHEEAKLEDWLEQDISIVSDDLLVIGRQVQTEYGGYIDLLCVDRLGDIVILELKRNKTPREVAAQALDYASWVKDLANDRISDIAEAYFAKAGKPAFDESYEKQFGTELPEVINANHRMLIIGSEIDSQTERIILYLSDTYGVGINVLTFQYFEDKDGKKYIGRVFLMDPKEIHISSTSKRKQRLSLEELKDIAVARGVGDLYEAAFVGLSGVFKYTGTSQSQVAFVGTIEGNKRWIFDLIPEGSDREKGLKYYVYTRWFSEYLGISKEEAVKILPGAGDSDAYKETESSARGYFTSTEQIIEFVQKLKSLKARS